MAMESLEAVNKYINSVMAYIGVEGDMIASPLIDPIKRIIYNLSGD